MRCSVLLGAIPALLFLLQLPGNAHAQEAHWQDYKYGRQGSEETSFCSWKCLQFTLQWPGGFCQSLDRESLCRIPDNINSWTIHGLWPKQASGCCDCWPMFHSDVQELEAELTERWPSLLTTRSSFTFWKGEWEKHGACAACVEGINSPLRYFQLCLKLRAQFDIHRLLEDAGITPSCDRVYKDREVWFQLKIPLSRNLTLGCDHHGDASGWGWSPGHPCSPQVPFYYLPIDHQQPWRPCD
uniref:Uncharacterized protein n=1 Tax=Mola mola TaxID=94237 RepID=A0A3Q3W842_MOLML